MRLLATLLRLFRRRPRTPQVDVRATRDLSGWVLRSRKARGRWSIAAGQSGRLDVDEALEFARKGYVEIL